MTAIAYRNGIMAGDTLCGYGPVKAYEQKVFKRDGYLIGMAGNDMPSIEDALKWFFAEIKAPRRVEFKAAEFTLLVVTPTGAVQTWHESGLCQPIKQRFWAIGSGAGVCLGAMESGASASKAVAAAIKWADGCGGKVITKRLKCSPLSTPCPGIVQSCRYSSLTKSPYVLNCPTVKP